MALNVTYVGPLPVASVGPLSDGTFRTCPYGLTISVPNDDAARMMGTPDWQPGDAEAAAYVPAPGRTYREVLVRDDDVLVDADTLSQIPYAGTASQLAAGGDTRIRRTATKTVTVDDGAGGGAALAVLGQLTAAAGLIVGAAGDTRLYRSAVKTVTVDDGAGGPAILQVVGRQHSILASTGDIIASAAVTGEAFSRWLAYPTGQVWGPGSGSIDTRLFRSGAKVLTFDDGAGGPMIVQAIGEIRTSTDFRATRTDADPALIANGANRGWRYIAKGTGQHNFIVGDAGTHVAATLGPAGNVLNTDSPTGTPLRVRGSAIGDGVQSANLLEVFKQRADVHAMYALNAAGALLGGDASVAADTVIAERAGAGHARVRRTGATGSSRFDVGVFGQGDVDAYITGPIVGQYLQLATRSTFNSLVSSGQPLLIDQLGAHYINMRTNGVSRFIVTEAGQVQVATAGQGLRLRSPDGNITRTLTIDNAGNPVWSA